MTLPDPARADRPEPPGIGKAAFLGGLLAFAALVSLSVLGVGHARTIRGAANAQYWIVTLLVAGAFGWATLALARTPARTRVGDIARRVGVAAAALWLALFLWEAAAVGAFGTPGPLELAYSALKG